MKDLPTTRYSLLASLQDPRNDSAWSEFLSIYEPVIYAIARKKGLQDADARDLCQELFGIVGKAIERWEFDRERGSFRGWLFRIARNLSVNLLTRRVRDRGIGGGPDSGGGADDSADGLDWRTLEQAPASRSFDPAWDADAELVDWEYRRRLFRWAADSIRKEFTASTWQGFWLTAVERLPVKEVASRLGVSPGAVYIAKSRVLARLRERVGEIADHD